MSFAVMAILLPLLAAPVLAVLGGPRAGARANLVLCLLVFLLTLVVADAPGVGVVHADRLGVVFGILTGFIGLTGAVGSSGRVGGTALSPRQWRAGQALNQARLGFGLLGLYADNIGLLWLAVEAVSLVGAVGARRELMLGAAGMVVAGFGTLLVYLAAQPVLGPGVNALSFLALDQVGARLDGPVMSLAFVFVLFGYGVRLGRADGVGPLAVSALPLLNLVLLAVLRFSHLARASGGAPGALLLGLGLVALLAAGIGMMRRQSGRRLLALSTWQHVGLAVFAFGVGGAAAIFAGLLQMILHTLVKAGLARAAVGEDRWLFWLFGAGLFALTGLPPSGLFVSEYLIVSQTIGRLPWLAAPLLLGLLLGAVALVRAVAGRDPVSGGAVDWAGRTVLGVHLGLAVGLGFAMPAGVVAALSAAAAALR